VGMERFAFSFCLGAGFVTCGLWVYRGYVGAAADWVFGFCCLLWGFLMLARIAALTSPVFLPKENGHLARRLINALYRQDQASREDVLTRSFGPSFIALLFLSLVYAGWNLITLFMPEGRLHLFTLAQNLDMALMGSARPPALLPVLLFDWAHGFLVILTFLMAGFVLRSFMQQRAMLRVGVLILSGYIAAGAIVLWDLFLPLSPLDQGAAGADLPTVLPMGLLQSGQGILPLVLGESGLIGLMLFVLFLMIPLTALWAGFSKKHFDDGVLLMGGTLGAAGLVFALLIPFSAVLGGYILLCAMAIFLAWGGAEARP